MQQQQQQQPPPKKLISELSAKTSATAADPLDPTLQEDPLMSVSFSEIAFVVQVAPVLAAVLHKPSDLDGKSVAKRTPMIDVLLRPRY